MQSLSSMSIAIYRTPPGALRAPSSPTSRAVVFTRLPESFTMTYRKCASEGAKFYAICGLKRRPKYLIGDSFEMCWIR